MLLSSGTRQPLPTSNLGPSKYLLGRCRWTSDAPSADPACSCTIGLERLRAPLPLLSRPANFSILVEGALRRRDRWGVPSQNRLTLLPNAGVPTFARRRADFVGGPPAGQILLNQISSLAPDPRLPSIPLRLPILAGDFRPCPSARQLSSRERERGEVRVGLNALHSLLRFDFDVVAGGRVILDYFVIQVARLLSSSSCSSGRI